MVEPSSVISDFRGVAPAISADAIDHLIAKYGDRVPRYTSYPTAPHFKPDVSSETYAEWLSALDPVEPISVYVHVPFCRSLCWYCGCNMSVVRSRAPVSDYVGKLIDEMRLVRRHTGARLTIRTLHFGGGTPNVLAPEDLKALFAELRQSFRIDSAAEIAAEIDPRVLTTDWVNAAIEVGLNRVSLGVQDTDSRVQQAVNRIQPLERTKWAAFAFRSSGAMSINVDLMYGLPFQTEASISRTIGETLELAPDRLALFGYAHVPWMKPAQRLLPDDAMPTPRERFDQQAIAAELLAKAGYVPIGLDHFAKQTDRLARAAISRNFQGYTTDTARILLGFGASAIGKLPQGYVQNAARTPDWRNCIADHRLATARGVHISDEDTFRGELISRLMCDLFVDIDNIAARFGFAAGAVDPDLERLSEMEDDGLVVLDGRRVKVTELGRPFLRAVCTTFDGYFKHSSGRYSGGV